MTDRGPDGLQADRIREAAAAWIARIERRSSPRLQRKLDQWLADDPRHAATYRRMTQRFDGARTLRTSQRYADRPRPARRPSRAAVAAGAFAVAACALLLVPTVRLPWSSVPDQPPGRSVVTANNPAVRGRLLVAPIGTIKAIGFEDGSVVTLDTESAVEVAFAPGVRRVTLLRGRARFTVAHDRRPFTVLAGGGSVTARGTIFDVSLNPRGEVGVALLQGVIDVAAAVRTPSAVTAPRARRLLAGQSVGYARGSLTPQVDIVRAGDPVWPKGVVDFDNVSLDFLLDRANQGTGTGPPIRLADPSLATLRVSGRFELRDRDRLAANMARLFDLRADTGSDTIVLQRE